MGGMWIVAIVGGSVVLGVGWVLASYKLDVRRRRRRIESALRSSVRDAADGQRVRIVGVVTSEDPPRKAPYSGRACVGFVAQQSAQVPDEHGNRTLAAAPVQEVAAFGIDDGTGTIHIDIEDLEIDAGLRLLGSHEVAGRVFGAKLVDRNSLSATYTERAFAVGDRVAVLGVARKHTDGTVWLTGTPRDRVLLTDNSDALA